MPAALEKNAAASPALREFVALDVLAVWRGR